MTLIDEAKTLLPELQALRRELHRNPEVGLQLPETQARVLAALDGLPLEIARGRDCSSVVAVLRGCRPGPVVLLRGDMDALPLREDTGLEYASQNGAMHACGHDLHTAGLVGAAKLLSAHRDELPGSVVFMFQPGEEGYNGASVMLREGLLEAAGERPVAAFATHVEAGERGVFVTRAGTMTSGASNLHITVRGRGGHGSMPFAAADPVPAIAELVTGLQVMLTRRFDAQDPIVISVTQLSAGEGLNIIPSSATLGATVRTLSQASLDALPGCIEELAQGIAAAHGCTADVDFQTLDIPMHNDASEVDHVLASLRRVTDAAHVRVRPTSAMPSEDFAFVLDQVPGAMFMLGASPEGVDPATAAPNHSPNVLFDDSLLGLQAAALAQVAWDRLAAGDSEARA